MGALVDRFDVKQRVKAENGNRLVIDLLDILPERASSVLESTFSAEVNLVTLLDEMYEDGATITIELNPTFKPSTTVLANVFLGTSYDFDESLNVVDLAADAIGASNLPSNIVPCRSSAMSGKMCLLLGSDAAKCVPLGSPAATSTSALVSLGAGELAFVLAGI